MKLAFFGYGWNPERRPDAYMQATMDALVQAGVDLDFYHGGEIAARYGIHGVGENVRLEEIAEFIGDEAYDAAISFNNSLLLPEVRAAIGGRVVTILVDEPEHLFDYRQLGPFEAMRGDVEIVAMSSAVERKLLDQVPGVQPRLHFQLPATHIDPGPRPPARYPISWAASYVGDHNLEQYLRVAMERPDFNELTRVCLEVLASEGGLARLAAEGGREAVLIAALPWTLDFFQSQLQNILTNRQRVEAVERLAPLGLALFGNHSWQKLLTSNAAVMSALQPGPPPTTHAELRAVYNASKISINVPQAHVAAGSVQYRMIDVMASGALLITKRSERSDLHRVFGDDCPVPTYTDLEDLALQCRSYLADEPARIALVQACNQLVASGFSFDERATELLRIARATPSGDAPPGELRRIDLRMFGGV